VVTRTRGAPAGLIAPVRAAVQQVEPDQPVFAVRTMEQILATVLAPRRFAMVCLVTFSTLAIILAALGLYGVIAFGVMQRRRELGVRMALGASPARMIRMVMGGGLQLAGLALIIGLIGAVAR